MFVGLVLAPVRLRRGERAFVLWAGLKGVVPILLGTYAVAEAAPDADRIYAVVFVVVLLSVVVQGGLVPTLARVWHVPMRVVEPEPWTMGMRFRDRPEGLHRYVVERGSQADGVTIRDLPLDEDVWVSVVSRAGRMVQVSGIDHARGGRRGAGDHVGPQPSPTGCSASATDRPGERSQVGRELGDRAAPCRRPG